MRTVKHSYYQDEKIHENFNFKKAGLFCFEMEILAHNSRKRKFFLYFVDMLINFVVFIK